MENEAKKASKRAPREDHELVVELKELMAEHDLTSREVANILGLSVTTIHCWRGGSSLPSATNIQRLRLILTVADQRSLIEGQKKAINRYREEIEDLREQLKACKNAGA